MKLASSPASIADMKTMTPTPIAMPLTMNAGLHAAFVEETYRCDPLEGQPTVHGNTGLMRWPVITPLCWESRGRPRATPSRISTWRIAAEPEPDRLLARAADPSRPSPMAIR